MRVNSAQMSYFHAEIARVSARSCLQIGTSLAGFYKQCSFHRLGMGVAGGALPGKRHRWASEPEELFLPSCNLQPALIPICKHIFLRSQRVMRPSGLANGTHGGEQMSSDFNGFTVLTYHGEPHEDIDSVKLMQMYGGREMIRQPSSSSSYCSSFSSSPSPEYLIMGNGSNATSTAVIRRTNSSQVSSNLNEDIVMTPSTNSIQPTPISTSANSFNQLDNFNQMTGTYNVDAHGGTSASTAGTLTFGCQLNNEDNPGPSLVSHDRNPRAQYPCLSDIAPYFTSSIVADSSTPLLSLIEPITQQQEIHYDDQAHIDHRFFPEFLVQSLQCAYNASCNGELDESAYGMSLESYAHEIGGLGCSHDEEAIAVQHRSCSQLQTLQNDDQQPEWGNMYSDIDIYGRDLSAPRQLCAAHEVPSGAAHVSTVLSTSPAACSFTDQVLEAQEKLDRKISVAQTQGNTGINKELMGLISTVSEAYHDTFSHKQIPNHDQGVQMTGLSTGLAPTSCRTPAAAATYAGDFNNSADKADDQTMQQESIRRINELIKKGLSGQSDMQAAQYMIRNSSGVQDQPQEMSSSGGTPQNEAATLHMIAERKRRRKHGECIKILSTLVPTITKKKDKVTVLESTIEYIKEMQALACKHDKGKLSLENMSNEEYQGEMEISCNSQQHAEIAMKSSQNISSETNATCKYVHSSSAQDVYMPHFQLCLNTSVKKGNSNVPIIEIISALQKKSLHCIHFKSEFLENATRLVVKILATYKDGTPNMDEIQHIKQWWRHLIIAQLSAKWKL